jgi:hypothetical protein
MAEMVLDATEDALCFFFWGTTPQEASDDLEMGGCQVRTENTP